MASPVVGQQWPYPAYPPAWAYPPYGYTYGYAAYWPYAYWMPQRPRRAPGELYGLVVSWIVLSCGILSLLCGCLVLALAVLASAMGADQSLSSLSSLAGFVLAPLGGSALALYYGITGILRQSSPRVSLPRAWLFVALTALVLASEVVLWNLHRAPGLALAVLPLAMLAGVLPALAILAFTAQRLQWPTTRRRFWMSLAYGATLAPLGAVVLELLATIMIALFLRALGYAIDPAVAGINGAPSTPVDVVFVLLIISVVAPVVEEGLKPLGALLIMRRLRTPAEAFLLGLAAGIGFDMLETIGYIGSGEADWITVAIERLGAGLLHGVGASMAALGWYYLLNGKGIRWRWLRGFGGILYAMLQHALFNGSSLISLLPGPLGQFFSRPLTVIGIPLDSGISLYFVYYLLILALLVYVTRRLMRGTPSSRASDGKPPIPSMQAPPRGEPIAGGAR